MARANPKRDQALELFKQGYTTREVAIELNMTTSAIANWRVHLRTKGLLRGDEARPSRPTPKGAAALWEHFGGPVPYHLTGGVPVARERLAA